MREIRGKKEIPLVAVAPCEIFGCYVPNVNVAAVPIYGEGLRLALAFLRPDWPIVPRSLVSLRLSA